METGLTGKIALVTGASRGIGAACALALAQAGAVVAVNYHASRAKAESVAAEIEAAGGRAMALQADVRERQAVNRMVDDVVREYGHVDILVNNANIDFPIKPFVELTWDQLAEKITGEMKALYNCSQAVLPSMMSRRSGKLIFISSTLSRDPGYGFSAHSAAKAAMDGIARVMAAELGPAGITVNTVGPGLVETDATAGLPPEVKKQTADFTPLRRIGRPEDVAGVVVMLASPMSDYLTGQYIAVCGGAYMN